MYSGEYSGKATGEVEFSHRGFLTPDDVAKADEDVAVFLNAVRNAGWKYLYIEAKGRVASQFTFEDSPYRIRRKPGEEKRMILEVDFAAMAPQAEEMKNLERFVVNICSERYPRAVTVNLAEREITYVNPALWGLDATPKGEQEKKEARDIMMILKWVLEERKLELAEDLKIERVRELDKLLGTMGMLLLPKKKITLRPEQQAEVERKRHEGGLAKRRRGLEEMPLATMPEDPDAWGTPKSWNGVNCSLEFSEGPEKTKVVKATPNQGVNTMNLTLWGEAKKYKAMDIPEGEWRQISFRTRSSLSDLDSATLTMYQGVGTGYWEKDFVKDLSESWTTLEYPLPSVASEDEWKTAGTPAKMGYLLFKLSSKEGDLEGAFEISRVHLSRGTKEKESEASEETAPPASESSGSHAEEG